MKTSGMPYSIRVKERCLRHKRFMGLRYMRHIRALRPLRVRMEKGGGRK